MKKKKLNALLALALAFSMAFCEPATALANGITEVPVEETSGSDETEVAPAAPVTEETTSEEEGTEVVEETSGEESGTETAQESIEEKTEEDSTEAAQESTEEKTEEGSTETAQESTEAVTEEGSTEAAQESTEAVTEESSTETAEESTETEEETTESATGEAAALSEANRKTLKALGFKTMELSQAMIEEKAEYGAIATSMSSMKSGEDYLENEVVYFAESEEEALQIAECYGGTLSEYEYGIAVARIKQTVADAVKTAAIPEIGLPAVYPNIVYKVNDGWNAVADETTDSETTDSETEEPVLIDEEDVEHEEIIDPKYADIQLPCEDEHLYATAPNDTYYAKQWHHDTMNTVEAWNASKGNGVVVAVIDTGIDYNHPDLKGNILDSITTIDGADEKGYDGAGHGTHCAGIIAATANNGIGVSGMAPEAKIFSVKVLGDNGSGSTADITQGVIAATAKDVDVISMSLGGICWDSLFQQAIDKATAKGIVVVAAAGNEATIQKSYPAAYNNVISVAATDQDNQLTDFSNYGTWVDIAAPGLNILSTLPTGYTIKDVTYAATGYGYMSGTSMACPVVSGTVALMLGNSDSLKNTNSKAGAAKITKTLLDSTVPDGASSEYYWADYEPDPNYTYPLADAEATTYAVDTSEVAAPAIKFSTTPSDKNVVLAGAGQYFELTTTTPHSKIYYTINGKKPTAKTGFLYTGKISMPISGKIKIQAVTVVGSKTSKVFSKTYTFDVKATGLSSACGDTMTVAAGKSIQLSVDIAPLYVSSKKLEWTCDDAAGQIKVNKSTGKVTCKKGTPEGFTAEITAKTKDGTNLEKKFKVQAVNGTVEGLKLNKTDVKMSCWAETSGLSMKDTDGTKYVTSFTLQPEAAGGIKTEQYLYKSSNTKVAAVDAYGNVTALGKGKATITVTANDGSGKKAACKVTVATPVFDIYTYSSTGFSGDSDYIPIGTGCSITMKSIINYGSSYYLYTPSNKKLDWTSGNPSAITVKNGKVTCKADAPIGQTYTVKVSANDGFGASQTITFKVVDAITKIYLTDRGREYTSARFSGKVGDGAYDLLYNGLLDFKTKNGTNNWYNGFTVTTSNRDVVYRYFDYDADGVIIVGTKPGSSKITYTARDGSNKKFTISCKITK